jgi:hypothetical protein
MSRLIDHSWLHTVVHQEPPPTSAEGNLTRAAVQRLSAARCAQDQEGCWTNRRSRASHTASATSICSILRSKAKKTLPDIVKDEMPDGDRRDVTVDAKDVAGQIVWRITLSLVVGSPSQGSTANT